MLLSVGRTIAQDYQIQRWDGSTSQWVAWDDTGGVTLHGVSGGALVDVAVVNGDDYFMWPIGAPPLFGWWARIRKNKLPKASVKEAFQKAADGDVFMKIRFSTAGVIEKVELHDS